jgi:hypothetical protein
VPMSLGARELRFAQYFAAVVGAAGAPLLLFFLLVGDGLWVVQLPAMFQGGAMPIMSIVRLLACLGALPLIILGLKAAARLALALPAVALDEPGALLKDAWHHSRAEANDIFHGFLACILPGFMLWGALYFMLNFALGGLAGPLVQLFGLLAFFTILALVAGYYAYVYALLAERGAVSEEEASPLDPLPAA